MVGIEEKKKEVSGLYARVIPKADAVSLGGFTKDHTGTSAMVTTDQLAGYAQLEKDFENMVRMPSGKKGSNFPEIYRAIMNLKNWLSEIHHYVCNLQGYLDE